MRLIDAVNLILPKLGERPVTNIEVPHPTLAVLLPEVENALRTTLIRGWWFNEFKYTAPPNNEGRITLGIDTLRFIPNAGEPLAAMRGLELYNPETMSFVWDRPIKGVVTQRVDFDLLPESAAQYVWYSALINVYVTDLGLAQEVSIWTALAQDAYEGMLAEHVKQRKYSTKNSPRFQRLRRAMRG